MSDFESSPATACETARPRSRRAAFSFLLVAGVLVAVDALCGIASLFIRPTELAPGLPVHHDVAPHPYKSYILTPGQVFYKRGEHTTDIAGLHMDWGLFTHGTCVNSFGHQVLGNEIEHLSGPKPAGEFRILFLGGSTTFLPWPFLIGETISKNGARSNVRIINAGTGGYTSQENLIDLAICGFSYQPDLVVAYLPVNDIGQTAHYPHFRRDYTHMRTPLSVVRKLPPPQRRIRPLPFSLRLVDTIQYNRALSTYAKQADLIYHITRQDNVIEGGHIIFPEDFEATTEAVIDNVFSMDALCRARKVPFVLLTQKMFKVDEPYTKVIYQRTLECGDRLMASERLRDVKKWNMQKLLPDAWDDAARDLVRKSFPGRVVDFSQPLAYDDMHFTPGGSCLFAAKAGEILVSSVKPTDGGPH